MGASLEIRLHDRLEDLSEPEWEGLMSRCPSATVFQRLGWLRSWHDAFVTNGRLTVVTAHRAGRLVGAAPLFVDLHGLRTDEGILKFVGHEHSDYNTFLADPAEPGVIDSLLDAMELLVPCRGSAQLQEIPEDSSVGAALLSRVHERGSWMRTTYRTACPYLPLESASNPGAAPPEPPSLRRHASRLAKAGTVSVRHDRDTDSILPHLPAFFEQHVRRWAGTPFPSLFTRAANRRFYEAIARRLGASGAVLFTTVLLDGRACAYHFGLVSGRRLLWYKPSFDIGLAAHSPGQYMLRELIRLAVEERMERLDFTRGDEAFKSRITSLKTHNTSVVMLARARDRLLFDTRVGARRFRDRIRLAFTSGG
ncbi:MAG TPA: GNAT family N-acetyltransferase [Steroidobacteraceae bacterium]|nr:GNAT family N-acetyltransferase [Steroidobacteraceae bacterium]